MKIFFIIHLKFYSNFLIFYFLRFFVKFISFQKVGIARSFKKLIQPVVCFISKFVFPVNSMYSVWGKPLPERNVNGRFLSCSERINWLVFMVKPESLKVMQNISHLKWLGKCCGAEKFWLLAFSFYPLAIGNLRSEFSV